jgi:hypothetical protein
MWIQEIHGSPNMTLLIYRYQYGNNALQKDRLAAVIQRWLGDGQGVGIRRNDTRNMDLSFTEPLPEYPDYLGAESPDIHLHCKTN